VRKKAPLGQKRPKNTIFFGKIELFAPFFGPVFLSNSRMLQISQNGRKMCQEIIFKKK
jgi:hypothetical protein